MSQILESAASSEPTPPGTADPVPLDRHETAKGSTPATEAPAAPADPLEDIQNRQHPFAG